MSNVIDASNFLNTQGVYSRQTKTYREESKVDYKQISSLPKKTDRDSVDISGESRDIPQAGYSRPAMRVTNKTEDETTYKPINSDGIQEGVELSDKAKNLLKELQEKYGDKMDIYIASWNTDDEEDYYANLSDKQYSALINPELLEEMANDDEVREKYESILSSAGETSDKLREELGEEIAQNIKSFTVSIDKDGNVSYMVSLLKDFTEKNSKSSKELKEEHSERLEEKRKEEKALEKKKEKEERYEKITASSLDELIQMLKDKYSDSLTEESSSEE